MALTRRGLGEAATTLRRPSAGGGASSPSLVSALSGAAAGGSAAQESLRSIPVADLAPHPDNPRTNMADLQELADSIRNAGLRQPIVVVPRDAFLASNPGLAISETAQWVVLAGHRRLAAARQGGIDSLLAWVRPDLASRRDAGETFIVENIHRQALSPLEEAAAYALLADLGLSQRDIAQRSGVSQANVSKRMSLLTLPPQVQDALSTGALAVTEALALTAAAPDHQLASFELAKQRSIPVVSAISQVERRAQEGRGSEAGAGGARPTPTTQSSARAAAVAELAARRPSQRTVTDALVTAVLLDQITYNRALRLVQEWLGDSVGITEANPKKWVAEVNRSDSSKRAWIAWALTLASRELHARGLAGPADEDVLAYVELLRKETGYQPTEWERGLPTSSSPPGDSDGIIQPRRTASVGAK